MCNADLKWERLAAEIGLNNEELNTLPRKLQKQPPLPRSRDLEQIEEWAATTATSRMSKPAARPTGNNGQWMRNH